MSNDRKGKKRVIVVGGGISGLSCAFLIQQLAADRGLNIELVLLEKLSETGGSTRTDIEDGFTCEWGPNGFLDNEPKTLELVDKLDLESELIKADESAANRYIFHHGKMHLLPTKPPKFLASDILPFHAKLRMARELFIPASTHAGDETVKAFGERRLGKSFAKYMLDPMVSGIFAGDAGALSLKAVFPKMIEMEQKYGGLFKAQFAKKKEKKKAGKTEGVPSGPSGTLHTFRKGMGQLTQTLATKVVHSIFKGVEVKSIDYRNDCFHVFSMDRTWTANAVVMAQPSYAAAEAVTDLSPDTATALRDIPYAPVDVVCHGHTMEQLGHPLNGFGVLIPRSEGIRSLGTLWSDSIFPGQAPPNRKLLRTILGGAHDPAILELSSGNLHNLANSDHSVVMDVKGNPLYKKHFRHPQGIAQYNVGHLQRVAKADRLQKELPGLFFTGAGYRGVSVNGVVKDAFRIADELMDIIT